MATWDNVVYTTQGLNLMAKLQTGAALEITQAIGSDGHVSADALPALTEITAKQTLTLSDAIYKGNGQALLPVTLYNRGLTEGYPLRQIGIYATDPDDGEVLMLVAQSETPDTIPTELASPDFVANFSFHVALGNAGRINVTYSLTDMATRADLDNINAQLANKANISDLGQAVSTDNGYYLNLSNILIQWASKTVTVPSNSGAVVSWAFPVAYNNYNYKVFASPIFEGVNNFKYAQVAKPASYYRAVVYLRNNENYEKEISVNLFAIGMISHP